MICIVYIHIQHSDDCVVLEINVIIVMMIKVMMLTSDDDETIISLNFVD